MRNRETILGVIRGQAEKIPYRTLEGMFSITSGSLWRLLKRFRGIEQPLKELEELSEEELVELFCPSANRLSKEVVMPDFEFMYKRAGESGSRLNMSRL